MEKVELYDILTLEDGEEYTVISRTKEEDKNYLLLAPIDKEETPNFDKIKIAEEITENNELIVQEVDNDELLKTLSSKFLTALKNDFE